MRHSIQILNRHPARSRRHTRKISYSPFVRHSTFGAASFLSALQAVRVILKSEISHFSVAVTERRMDPIEIPVASPFGKLVVIGCCVLIVIAVLWWAAPKFKTFLITVLRRASRKPETTNLHIILGFVVYLIILAPVVIATYVGVGVATTAPTLISSIGITGTTFVCEGWPTVVIFSCSTPFSLRNRRKTITWNEIDRVECTSRHDGTISALYISSRTQRIEIGSFAIHDLSGAHDAILAHAPRSAAQPCQAAFRANLRTGSTSAGRLI
jgi:hypothetical protein